jgi:hypothetical protein
MTAAPPLAPRCAGGGAFLTLNQGTGQSGQINLQENRVEKFSIGYRSGAGAKTFFYSNGAAKELDITDAGALVWNGTLTASGLATSGTIAGSVCATSGGVILYESGATGCTISLEELKHDIAPVMDSSNKLMALRPISFGFNDPAMPQHRMGFGAHQVASVDAALSTTDGAGNLQAYDPNGVLALTVAVVQKQEREILWLMVAAGLLALWCAGLTFFVLRRRPWR